MQGLLEGLRVIDVGTRVAAPFCAGTLGEQGAEVIKVEQPEVGEYLRRLGPFADDYSLMWSVEGRHRKSVTLDLRKPEGQDLFRRLSAASDVVCENFRPGTMERWNIGPADLAPHLVLVRISVFGQDGPYATRPGVDLLGLAYSGLLDMTGPADGPPVKSNVTISDHLTGVLAAKAAVVAVYARDVVGTREGSVIDASLYGSVVRTLGWQFAALDRCGIEPSRSGNADPNLPATGVFLAADDRFVVVAATSDAQFAALVDLVGLEPEARSWSASDRVTAAKPIGAAIAAWAGSMVAEELVRRCHAARVPAAVARTAQEVSEEDPGAPDGYLVSVGDPVLGPVLQQAPHPRVAGVANTPRGAAQVGEHNEEIWCGLVGLSTARLEELRRAGTI